jgi:hypothetical protein
VYPGLLRTFNVICLNRAAADCGILCRDQLEG